MLFDKFSVTCRNVGQFGKYEFENCALIDGKFRLRLLPASTEKYNRNED